MRMPIPVAALNSATFLSSQAPSTQTVLSKTGACLLSLTVLYSITEVQRLLSYLLPVRQ